MLLLGGKAEFIERPSKMNLACLAFSLFFAFHLCTCNVNRGDFKLNSTSEEDIGHLAVLVENLLSLDNTELNFVSDFANPAQTELARKMAEMELPFYIYEVTGLRSRQLDIFFPMSCPIFYGGVSPDNTSFAMPEHKTYIREHVMPAEKYHRSILVWTESSGARDEFMRTLDDSVSDCEQYKDPGILALETRFYFISRSDNDTENLFVNEGNKRIRGHPNVVSIQKIEGGEDMFAIYSYDYFDRIPEKAAFLKHVWSPDNKISDLGSIFIDFSWFFGHPVEAHIMPTGYSVYGRELTEEEGLAPDKQYSDYGGSEISMFLELERRLGFTPVVRNPVDSQWAGADEDGRLAGMVGDVARGEADMQFGCTSQTFNLAQAMRLSTFYDVDCLTFVSPAPLPRPKYIIFVRPFELLVWILLIVFFPVTATFLCVYANTAKALVPCPNSALASLNKWGRFQTSLWNCYAVLLGEDLSTDRGTPPTGFRFILGVWMIFSLVMRAGFSGNLKSYMTKPLLNAAIDSTEAVVKSGLPWEIILYGTDVESQMSKSNVPLIENLWNDKVEIPLENVINLDKVFQGKIVRIEWLSVLAVPMKVNYTLPTGEELINNHRKPVYYADFIAMGFNVMYPAFNRFDSVIKRMIEAGLVFHYIDTSLAEIDSGAFERGEKLFIVPPSDIRPLTLDDLQGAFMLAAICLVLATVTLFVELGIGKAKNKSKEVHNSTSTRKHYYA